MIGIAAAISAVAVFAMAMGISYPLLALILERGGYSETYIGINSAMLPLGILASSPLIPWAARKFDVVALAIAGGAGTAVLLFAFAVISDATAWFALRFLLGIAINVLWVISETWINQLSPERIRGRIMGVYTTVVAGGFALGPVTLALVGVNEVAAFAVAVGSAIAVVAILFAARRHLPGFPPSGADGLRAFARAAPLLLLAVGAIALFDQTTLSLMPIFGLRSGLDEAAATLAVGVLVAGNLILQIPIGWLADVWPRRVVIVALAVAVAVCAAVVPAAAGTSLFWPILFAWGAVGYGAYTVTLAELGARFSGAALLAGNAAFAVMWGIGGLIGPAAAGAAMDAVGAVGLPLVLGTVFAILAAGAIWRPLVRREYGRPVPAPAAVGDPTRTAAVYPEATRRADPV